MSDLSDERLTAREAACHPFFASYFPVGFLLGDASTGMLLCLTTEPIWIAFKHKASLEIFLLPKPFF